MEYEEFESILGNVAVTKDHIEREERESEEWSKILENFDAEELLDKIHFSKIEHLRFRKGAIYPCIKVKSGDEWKLLFFKDEDDCAEECFKCLNYRWKSYQQLYH